MSLFKKSTNKKLLECEKCGEALLYYFNTGESQTGINMLKKLANSGNSSAATIYASLLGSSVEKYVFLEKYISKKSNETNPEITWLHATNTPEKYKMKSSDDCIVTIMAMAEFGNIHAMIDMGKICELNDQYVESMYWYGMAYYNGDNDTISKMKEITQKWISGGKDCSYKAFSMSFNDDRFRCSLFLLEKFYLLENEHYSNEMMDNTLNYNEILSFARNGEVIAIYIMAEKYVNSNNIEKAKELYNLVSPLDNPHIYKNNIDLSVSSGEIEKSKSIVAYAQAAALGDRESMYLMGKEFSNNNDKLAAYWYGRAYVRGYKHALTQLIKLSREHFISKALLNIYNRNL